MSAPVCTIAVIVPVHNAAKYLPDCLDAIAAQQFDAFCCVLVDDGSRDESPLLCDNMAAGDARFTVIHQPQRGVSAARTAGLRRALEIGAEWIAFCDADDLYHPAFLSTLYKAVQETHLPLACCRYDTFADALPAEAAPPAAVKRLDGPAHLDAADPRLAGQ